MTVTSREMIEDPHGGSLVYDFDESKSFENSLNDSDIDISRSSLQNESFIAEEIVNEISEVDDTKLLKSMKVDEEHFYSGLTNNKSAVKNETRASKKKGAIQRMISHSLESFKYHLKKHYNSHKEKKWQDSSILRKAIYILIDFPTTLLLDITIPSCEIERWNRIWFILSPISVTTFVILISKSYNYLLMHLTECLILFSILFVISILFFFCTYRNRLPYCIGLLSLYSFVMSITWIWFIATNLIDILTILGVCLNVPEAFLGMTFLAFGNSTGDFALNLSLAKGGYGEMALAGSITGPLFNLLVGIGVILLKKTFIHGEIKFNMFAHENLISLIGLSFVTINLIRLMLHAMILKFRLNLSIAIIGYIFYFIFFLIICVITFL